MQVRRTYFHEVAPPPPRARYRPGRNTGPVARVALCAAAILLLSAAPSAHSETLYEALTAAYNGNPGLEAERERQKADEEDVRQAIADWLPTVTLDAEQGSERTKTRPPRSITNITPKGLELTLRQPLFRGFRTFNGKREADAEALAGLYQLNDTEQATLLDAVTAYVDVLRDRKIRALRQSNVRYLQTELKASKVRQRAGDLSKTDVAQAATRVHEGNADLSQARADEAASEADYVAIIGHKPVNLSTPPLPKHLVPKTYREAVALADAQNPNISSARYLQEAARREKLQAYGELLPTVSLEMRHDQDFGDAIGNDETSESSVFVRLNMPLYQGGSVRSRIRQSRATESSRRYQVADTRRQTRASVTDAWQQTRAARERIKSAKLQVGSAREALKGVKIETEVGERAFFEILDAQRELVDAEVALARAKRDLYVSSYTLLANVGRLRAHLLNLPVDARHTGLTKRRLKSRNSQSPKPKYVGARRADVRQPASGGKFRGSYDPHLHR